MREAARRGSLRPLVSSVTNRYHPRVDDFLAHADEVRGRSGWDRALSPAVWNGSARSTAASSSTATARSRTCWSRPVIPASRAIPGTVHAYEPHEYASRVAIVGAGMAAAAEWLNALDAGSEVISIRRREPSAARSTSRVRTSRSAASPASMR